jgi:hypothetical protein
MKFNKGIWIVIGVIVVAIILFVLANLFNIGSDRVITGNFIDFSVRG